MPTTGSAAGAGLNMVVSVTKHEGSSKPNSRVSDDQRVSPAEAIRISALCAFAVTATAYLLNVPRREKLSIFAFYGLGVSIYGVDIGAHPLH